MGCDIHIVWQVKGSKGWKTVPCPCLDRYGYDRLSSRNYELFALLSGVRGDSPLPTGPIIPLDRGFPEDFYPGTKDDEQKAKQYQEDVLIKHGAVLTYNESGTYIEDYTFPEGKSLPKGINPYLGEHTFGYLTYGEFEHVDWSIVQKYTGYITPRQYEEYVGLDRFPDSWRVMLPVGENYRIYSVEEYRAVRHSSAYLKALAFESPWIQLSWEVPLFKTDLYKIGVRAMRRLWLQDPPYTALDTVRILVGYDS